MENLKNTPVLNLQLMAEGAAGDGGTAQGQGVTAGAASQQTKGVALSDVKYGIQEESAPAAEVQAKPAEPADLNAEFEDLINGKYKEQFKAKTQDIVRKRHKNTKEIVDKYNEMVPLMEMLGMKHGVDATNIADLRKAIEADDSYYEAEAFARDMTVEQLKAIKKIENENKTLKQREAIRQAQEKADRQHAEWLRQAAEAKQIYPELDLEAELQNAEFRDLLNANVDVQTAYVVIHRDEIIPAAMQYAVRVAEQNFSKKVAANGARPAENGMGAQASAVIKSDVSKLTKFDIDEVSRRVARGERVTFG